MIIMNKQDTRCYLIAHFWFCSTHTFSLWPWTIPIQQKPHYIHIWEQSLYCWPHAWISVHGAENSERMAVLAGENGSIYHCVCVCVCSFYSVVNDWIFRVRYWSQGRRIQTHTHTHTHGCLVSPQRPISHHKLDAMYNRHACATLNITAQYWTRDICAYTVVYS